MKGRRSRLIVVEEGSEGWIERGERSEKDGTVIDEG